MNVSLTPKLDDFVGTQVKAGRYRSASEVVREALRLLEIKQAETYYIQQALDEGFASNPVDGKVAMESVRRNLKGKHGV